LLEDKQEVPLSPVPEDKAQMKIGLLLPAVLASLIQTPPQINWTRFTDQVGGFAVAMPGTPREGARTVNTPQGALVIHIFMAQPPGRLEQYGVMYEDIPAAALRRPAAVSLNGAVQGAVRSSRSQLVDCQNISFHGFPGREFTLKNPNGVLVRMRTILVSARLYQITVAVPSQSGVGPDARKFISPFKLLPRT
jgi:hypothetical protein